jgi:hypothetical protein
MQRISVALTALVVALLSATAPMAAAKVQIGTGKVSP